MMSGIDRRGPRRANVMFMAVAEHGGQPKAVRLKDLSSGGAQVLNLCLPKGTFLILRRRDQSVRCRVAWSGDHRNGLQFDQQLNLRACFRHITKPSTKAAPRSTRPGLKCRPLKEGERAILARWANFGLYAVGD